MLENIEVLYHSSIRISKNKVIYIDPFKINKNYNYADIIFLTQILHNGLTSYLCVVIDCSKRLKVTLDMLICETAFIVCP